MNALGARFRRAGDVAVIDAGGANLGSVQFALERLGATPRFVRDADGLHGATHVILPGVGAAGPAMRLLRERSFDAALRTLSVPLLGICLGMQLLFERSEEGDVECLGVLKGAVRRLRTAERARSPHMGWNTLDRIEPSAPLLGDLKDGDQAFFVHGYIAPVTEDCIASVEHGSETFAALVQRGTVCGAQFHPERSGAVGARVLSNFLASDPG